MDGKPNQYLLKKWVDMRKNFVMKQKSRGNALDILEQADRERWKIDNKRIAVMKFRRNESREYKFKTRLVEETTDKTQVFQSNRGYRANRFSVL